MSEHTYIPDFEELEMAGDFIRVCSSKDLVECWRKASIEWDNKSIINLHRKICEAGRVNELIERAISIGEESNL